MNVHLNTSPSRQSATLEVDGFEVVGVIQENADPCPVLVVWNEEGEVIFRMEVAAGNFDVKLALRNGGWG